VRLPQRLVGIFATVIEFKDFYPGRPAMANFILLAIGSLNLNACLFISITMLSERLLLVP
jgi:hypothetical protein